MKISTPLFELAILTFAAAPGLAYSAELKPETLRAWNQYVRGADSHMHARLEPGRHFLWTDETPDRAERVRKGEILVAPMEGAGMQHVILSVAAVVRAASTASVITQNRPYIIT